MPKCKNCEPRIRFCRHFGGEPHFRRALAPFVLGSNTAARRPQSGHLKLRIATDFEPSVHEEGWLNPI